MATVGRPGAAPPAPQTGPPAPTPFAAPAAAKLSPFDPRRLTMGTPDKSPIPMPTGPAAPAPTDPKTPPASGPDSSLTPDASYPGGSPDLSQSLSSDFNAFAKSLLNWAKPPDYLDPTQRENQARILENEANREQDELTDLQKELAQGMKDRAQMEMDNLKPLFEAQRKQIEAERIRMDKAEAEIPRYIPPPTINPADASAMLFALLGVSLIGGLAGRARWQRVAANLNGSIEGLLAGDQERAARHNEAYKLGFESALAHYRAEQDRMREIVFATDLPINEILREAEVQAKLDGAEENFLLAHQGHIDKLRSQVIATEHLSDTLRIRYSTLQEQIDSSLIRSGMAGKMGAFAGTNLDKYGKWALAKIAAAGNDRPLIAATSRWANPIRAAIWNELGKEWAEQGRNPAEFNQAQITLAVARTTQRWIGLRLAAMARLQEALASFREPLLKAISMVNGRRPMAASRTINALIAEFGSGPEVEQLKYLNTLAYTVGREYATLATMPVSGAQMHFGSQQLADKLMNGNINLYDAQGFYTAVTLEAKNNRKILNDVIDASKQEVEGLGDIVKPDDFGVKANVPATEAEANLKYGPNTTDTTTARPAPEPTVNP